jgi:biotin transport system substrate-specific component
MIGQTKAIPVGAGRTTAVTAVGIIGFAAALAIASQAAIPVPGSPVPITLQPLVVVLAGFWLGPIAGAASMILYLMAGAAGLPVFAPIGLPGFARLIGPTGGYLLAYPLAAYVAGFLVLRARGYFMRVGAAAAGIIMIYAGGVAQLTIITGSLERAALLGLLPFLALDAVKAALAGIVDPRRR